MRDCRLVGAKTTSKSGNNLQGENCLKMKICIFQASLPQIVSDFIRQNICLKCHTSQNICYKKTRSKQSLFSNYPPVAWVELHFTKSSRGGLVHPKEELGPTFAFYRQALYLAPTSIFRWLTQIHHISMITLGCLCSVVWLGCDRTVAENRPLTSASVGCVIFGSVEDFTAFSD